MFENLEKIYQQFLNMLPQFILGIAVLLITIVIAYLIRKVIIKKLKPYSKNPLLVSFIGRVIALSINVLGIMIFLGIIGLGDVSSKILAGAGILTFIIGFAFKDIGENFLSGILLAFKSPFGVNDLITTDKVTGYVTEVNLRETVIKTLDGKDVFIPNSQIVKNPLINYTLDGFLMYEFTLGLDYKVDVQHAIKVIESTILAVDGVLIERKPTALIDELQEKKVVLRISYWIDTSKSKSKTYFNSIKSEVLDAVSTVLKANGFISN
jgi:small conductance mechanosensitive channel